MPGYQIAVDQRVGGIGPPVFEAQTFEQPDRVDLGRANVKIEPQIA